MEQLQRLPEQGLASPGLLALLDEGANALWNIRVNCVPVLLTDPRGPAEEAALNAELVLVPLVKKDMNYWKVKERSRIKACE